MSGVFVDVLDEARELERRSAHRPDRLLVVHPQRTDEADGAERGRADPVGRSDERDRVELRPGNLGPDVHDRTLRLERFRDQRENGSATLEKLDETHRRLDFLDPSTLDQPGRTADEDLGSRFATDVEERLPDEREESALARRQLRSLEAAAHRARSEAHADELILEVRARPRYEAWIDGVDEAKHPLRHATGRGDDDDHEARRLEPQYLDMSNRGGLERGCRDERQEPRRVGEHLGRRAQRLFDLVAHRAQVDAELVGTPLEAVDELLRVDPVAALGRRAAGRRVRMRQQPERFELREFPPHGRRRDAQPRALHEHTRADRLARGDVLLDDAAQDLALPWGELHPGSDGSRRSSGYQGFTFGQKPRTMWSDVQGRT